jgi:hypothetical protein
MGAVWLNDPLSGKPAWYDWCSYDYFVRNYANSFDKGRFFWVLNNPA